MSINTIDRIDLYHRSITIDLSSNISIVSIDKIDWLYRSIVYIYLFFVQGRNHKNIRSYNRDRIFDLVDEKSIMWMIHVQIYAIVVEVVLVMGSGVATFW